MKSRWKQIACFAVGALLAGAMLSGCGAKEKKTIEAMEKEDVPALSFDITGGADVMPIAGFIGPFPGTYARDGETLPQYISDDFFKAIADAGINFINYSQTDYEYYPGAFDEMMNLAGKYGIGVFVKDAGIDTKLGDETLSTYEIGERISNYADYPAFCGVYVTDEPSWPGFKAGDGSRDIEQYAPLLNRLTELGMPAYLNLLPSYADSENLEGFKLYVEEALSTCDVSYISYDHYCWDKGKEMKHYFYDMSVVREAAAKHNIPFWTYIQAGSQWNDAANRFDSDGYWPNQGQFDWNINTCLAYGAKGIQYFPMIQPVTYAYAESTEWDFERNGLFGAWGNKNRWYYYAQDIQTQISAVDEVLMNAVNKGVIVSGEQAKKDNEMSTCIMDGTSWRELDSVNGNALIGCFNYQGKTALYVVNYDYEYAQKITLNLYDKCKFSVVQDGEKEYLNGDHVTLDMRAGEGALIVFE